MKSSNKSVMKSHEDTFGFDDDPAVLALNFPPTEIDRLPTDEYISSDQFALMTFHYPSNVDRRSYQFDISKTCFNQNTLVCLPTGAGKTLIAAVAIMNFHRWYPTGKIIFMAPYRALVNQQIDACTSFTNIKNDDVTILTGQTLTANRSSIWASKSIFFCTPQIVQNDLAKGFIDPTKVCLVIIDEAHHARGCYAYVNVVRTIAARNSQFRVVALSATPGSDMNAIQSVIYNLLISKVIYKDDDDPDIAKHQHETNVEIVKVPLGSDETKLEDSLCQCISSIADPLVEKGYLRSVQPKWMTKGTVWKAMDQFKKMMHGVHDFFKIMDMFGILLSLATMQEKLTKYGASMLDDALKDFQKKRRETENKKQLIKSTAFQTLLRNTETTKNVSHPKLAKLSEILGDFYNEKKDSRCIVFTQFRAAAYAITDYLKNVEGVKPSIFIGKANTKRNAGLDEATQLEIVSLFRHGNINCIVATSVAEEGLDIGEVDLIVCYDTSSSPLKTVQRMGRTGRKRSGKVIFLMSEGYEEKNLEKAQFSRSMIKNKLTAAIDTFVLYQPEKPILPLPESCRAANVPCANFNKPKISEMNGSKNKDKECKSPYLLSNEMHHLSAVYNTNLKYPKINFTNGQIIDMGHGIISHSAESNILNLVKNERPIPLSIEREIAKIIKREEAKWNKIPSTPRGTLKTENFCENTVIKSNQKSSTSSRIKKVVHPFAIESSSSDDEGLSDDLEIPKPNFKNTPIFIRELDTESDDDEQSYEQKYSKPISQPPTPNIFQNRTQSFLSSDEDSSDEEMEIEADNRKIIKLPSFLNDDFTEEEDEIRRLSDEIESKHNFYDDGGESECPDVFVKKELTKKSKMSFLDDFEADSFDPDLFT